MLHAKVQRLLDGRGGNYIFPFLWLRGESEDVLREYMRVIHESNIGAVCVESRPHPDFCGPRWWRDMDIILDEARRRGMKVWILDDSHFPTGFANGAMASQPDALCRQSLCCRRYSLRGGEALRLDADVLSRAEEYVPSLAEQYVASGPARRFEDDRLLSVSAWNRSGGRPLDLTGFAQDGSLSWTAPQGEWTVCVLHLSRNQGYHRNYINMMDAASCRVLIDAVYEPHYARYKDDFGATIAGFFSDEPELGNGHLYDFQDPYGGDHDYPWSGELEKALLERFGPDYTLSLPLLWDAVGDRGEAACVRCAFMDEATRLVQRDFSEQLGSWCRERGVEYIGHLIEDDNHHTRTGCSLGHYFRGLAGQDMAGIDDIGNQVFPQGEDICYYEHVFSHRNGEFYHYLLGKLADSAAAIEPRKRGRSMCEIFGNYGWSEGVRLEKYLADHFLARGVNHFVPHAFSAREYPDPDCPPHFYAHGHNPQYRHFGSLMAYMNRMSELLCGGRHVSPVAILYHAEGDWTGEHMTADRPAHALADAQIDYDILPADVFAQRDAYKTQIGDGVLSVNTQRYRAFVLPKAQFIPAEVAVAVGQMQAAGVTVFAVDGLPEGVCRGEAEIPQMECVPLDRLVQDLERSNARDIAIRPADDRIRYRRYLHDDGTEVFFFINEGTRVYRGTVSLPQTRGKTAYRYDAWANALRGVHLQGDALSLELAPLHSFTLVLDASAALDEVPLTDEILLPDGARELPFSSPWLRGVCSSSEYPAFSDEKEVLLPDRLAEERPRFSGFVRYRALFDARQGERVVLEISDASEGVEVFLNGVSLGIQIVPPFRYDLSPALLQGENELRVEVATTLERENSGKPDFTGNVQEPAALSGITGCVRLFAI